MGSIFLDVVERELDRVLKVDRVRPHLTVGALPTRERDVTVDSRGQHKAVVVIGVLADQVDAARRAHHHFGRGPKNLLKRVLNHSRVSPP